MKKIISILIIFLIISPIWLTNSYIYVKKSQIKKQVKKIITSNIELKDLVLLKFERYETRSLLNWKHSKEFEFNGIMYDIVKTENNNDSIYYWCWEDRDETALNKTLSSLVNLSLNKKLNSHFVKVSNLISSLYTYNFSVKIKEPLFEKKGRIENNDHNFRSLPQEPNTPPPKLTPII